MRRMSGLAGRTATGSRELYGEGPPSPFHLNLLFQSLHFSTTLSPSLLNGSFSRARRGGGNILQIRDRSFGCGRRLDFWWGHGDELGVRYAFIAELRPIFAVRAMCRHGRFIPAGAGNSAPSTKMSGTVPVHPRGCGEQGRWRMR